MSEVTASQETGAERSAPVRGDGITENARRLAERWGAQLETETEAAPAEPEAAPTPDEGAQAEMDFPQTGEEPEHEAREDQGEVAQELPDHLTVDDLARDYGLDKNELMQRVRHPVKVGDEEKEVGLHELIMGYQRGREHEAAMAAVDRDRARWEADKTQKESLLNAAAAQLSTQSGILDRMFDQEESDLHARYDPTVMAQLRVTNPAEFSARSTEHQLALQAVQQRRSQAHEEIQRGQQQLSQVHSQQQAEQQANARQELVKLIPSWSEPEKFEAEGAELAQYLQREFGATEEQIAGIYDARILRLAYDSMQLNRLRSKASEVRKAPPAPVAQPGQQASPGAARFRRKRAQVEQARQRLRETGKLDDASAALAERWRK